MKKSKFTESQITMVLKEYESGKKVDDICRELGITRNTFYLWKKKYSGMDTEMLRKYKELERENSELKRMYADLSLDHRILKNVIKKSFKALSEKSDRYGDKIRRRRYCCQGLQDHWSGPVNVLLRIG